MRTFEEVNKYYRFPLHIPEWCPVYIETADNETAFNILQDKPELFNQLVQKLNDPSSIELQDTYKIVDDYVASKTTGEGILLVRGWGMLTGIGANHLDAKYAAEIQDSFLAICCDRLNTSV